MTDFTKKYKPNPLRPYVKPPKTVKKKPKAINKVSAKRQKQLDIYNPIRKKFLEENPYCQIKFEGCAKLSGEVHHSEGRDGEMLNEVEFFVATCRSCHRKHHDS